eukprot:3818843-Pyramimonas_sp.AAC.4
MRKGGRGEKGGEEKGGRRIGYIFKMLLQGIPEYNFGDSTLHAGWRVTQMDHDQWLASVSRESPFNVVSGFHLQTLWDDLLHDWYQGTAADAVANGLVVLVEGGHIADTSGFRPSANPVCENSDTRVIRQTRQANPMCLESQLFAGLRASTAMPRGEIMLSNSFGKISSSGGGQHDGPTPCIPSTPSPSMGEGMRGTRGRSQSACVFDFPGGAERTTSNRSQWISP